MSTALQIMAGRKALRHIRENGLSPDDIRVMAGAAGGPKWLVLNQLDRLIFSAWFNGRREALYLLGSSIGSWRFAAAAQENPPAAFDRFEDAYVRQSYSGRPSAAVVSKTISRILDAYLDPDGIRQILHHPYLRVNIMTVRSRGIMGSDNPFLLAPGLAGAAAVNGIRRDWLSLFFERALFHHAADPPPFLGMNGFPLHPVPLTQDNLRKALLASGSIPLVMSGVSGIPGAPAGMYRDGGVLDYHLDVDFLGQQKGLVLYPHYTNRIIPGWLDKKLPSRKPSAGNMDRVILLCPSASWINRLPLKKIPDRDDFYRFKGRDRARIAYWKTVINQGRRLSDAFWDAVDSGRIRQMAQPLQTPA